MSDRLRCGCMLRRSMNGNYYKCDRHKSRIDTALRKRFPEGMRDGTDITIKFNIGFENFGSYEGWGQGYVVEHIEPSTGDTLWTSDKYLDEAIRKFIEKPYRTKKKTPAPHE